MGEQQNSKLCNRFCFIFSEITTHISNNLYSFSKSTKKNQKFA